MFSSAPNRLAAVKNRRHGSSFWVAVPQGGGTPHFELLVYNPIISVAWWPCQHQDRDHGPGRRNLSSGSLSHLADGSSASAVVYPTSRAVYPTLLVGHPAAAVGSPADGALDPTSQGGHPAAPATAATSPAAALVRADRQNTRRKSVTFPGATDLVTAWAIQAPSRRDLKRQLSRFAVAKEAL